MFQVTSPPEEMKMNPSTCAFRTLSALLLAAVLAGCRLTAPAPTATAMFDIQPTLNAVKTEAFETVAAGLTRSAPTITPTATVTPTPTATNTPLPTAAPTRTRAPILWTWTPTLPSGGCIVVGSAPDPGSSFKPDAGFDASWNIKNKSGETWLVDQVRVRYVSGSILQTKEDEVDLSGDIGANSTTTVIVDMQAPSQPGTYSTNWAVYRDEKVQCGLTVTIRVKP
ncbi:MAG: NBR1-Ig-like domain-containing protein [Anaerolineaceae bacterium]